MLDLGLRTGEDSRDNSSVMPQLRGWFLGNSLRRCSKEYRRRSSFWLDSLKRAWAWKQGGRLEKKAKREEREEGWKSMETLVTWHFFPVFALVEHCCTEGSDSMTRTWILQPSIYLWVSPFFCDFARPQEFHHVFGSLSHSGLYPGVVTQLLHPQVQRANDGLICTEKDGIGFMVCKMLCVLVNTKLTITNHYMLPWAHQSHHCSQSSARWPGWLWGSASW